MKININNIPCIESKCLLYPICKHSKEINCTDLIKYYEKECLDQSQKIKDSFFKIFINLERLTPSDSKVPYFIYNRI